MTAFASALALSRAPLAAFAAMGLFWGAFAAQVPDIKAGLGAGDGGFGLALLCGSVGAVVAMLWAPRFDRRAGRFALPLAAGLMMLAFQGQGAATGVAGFALAMAACGAGTGLLDVVINARLSQVEARENRGLMSLNHGGFSLSYAGSAALTGLAREAGAAPAEVFLAVAVAAALLLPAMVMAAGPAAGSAPGGPRGRRLSRVILGTGLVMLVAFLAENAAESWSALHIERTLGGRAAEGALGPAMLGLTMGVGRLAGHFLTRRGAEARTILAASLLAAAGAFAAALAPAPAVAYAGFGVLGLGVSVMAPLAFALAGQRVAAADRALAISRVAVIGYSGFFLGPPLMGFIAEAAGLRGSFAAVGGLLLAAPLALLLPGGRGGR